MKSILLLLLLVSPAGAAERRLDLSTRDWLAKARPSDIGVRDVLQLLSPKSFADRIIAHEKLKPRDTVEILRTAGVFLAAGAGLGYVLGGERGAGNGLVLGAAVGFPFASLRPIWKNPPKPRELMRLR